MAVECSLRDTAIVLDATASESSRKIEVTFSTSSLQRAPTAKQMNEMRAYIQSLADFVPPDLTTPETLWVITSAEGNDFRMISPQAISAPYQRISMFGSKKHPRYSKANLGHEFAHAIFSLSVERRSRALFEFGEQHRVRMDELAKQGDAADSLKRQARSTRDEALATKAQELDDDFFSEASALDSRKRSQTLAYDRMSVSFDELFADVVPVAFFMDGSIFGKSFGYTRDKPLIRKMSRNGGDANLARLAQNEPKWRDFTIHHDASSWSEGGSHYRLSPVRSFIWERILSRPMFQREPRRTLSKIFKSILDEMDDLALNYDFGKNMSPAEQNQRLVARLTDEFGLDKLARPARSPSTE